MKRNLKANKSASGTMPPDAPPNGPSDEGSLLDLRGRIAEAAARQTFAEMIQDFKRVFQPQAWVREFPVPSMVTGAAAGFFFSGTLFFAQRPAPGGMEKGEAPSPTDLAAGDRSLKIWAMALTAGTNLLKEILVPLVLGEVERRKIPKNNR